MSFDSCRHDLMRFFQPYHMDVVRFHTTHIFTFSTMLLHRDSSDPECVKELQKTLKTWARSWKNMTPKCLLEQYHSGVPQALEKWERVAWGWAGEVLFHFDVKYC